MQPGFSRKLSLRWKFKCEGVVGHVVPGNRQEGWESESGKEGGRAMQGYSCGRPAVQSCTTHPRSHRKWTLGLSPWGQRRETHWCTGSMSLDQRLATAPCSGFTGRNPKTTEKSGLEANAWRSRPDGRAINLCRLEARLCPCRTGHWGHKGGSEVLPKWCLIQTPPHLPSVWPQFLSKPAQPQLLQGPNWSRNASLVGWIYQIMFSGFIR